MKKITLKGTRDIIIIIFAQILLFVLQFVLVPIVYEPGTNTEIKDVLILLVTTIIVCFVVMYFVSNSILGWLVGFLVYFAILYYTEGFGRLGIWNNFKLSIVIVEMCVVSGKVLITEILVWILVLINKKRIREA